MSDADSQRPGSPADRKPSTRNATAYGAGLGLTIAMSDWLILQCGSGGHWHYVPPSQTLIEMASPILLLPFGLWIKQVFSIIGDIIINNLKKDDQ